MEQKFRIFPYKLSIFSPNFEAKLNKYIFAVHRVNIFPLLAVGSMSSSNKWSQIYVYLCCPAGFDSSGDHLPSSIMSRGNRASFLCWRHGCLGFFLYTSFYKIPIFRINNVCMWFTTTFCCLPVQHTVFILQNTVLCHHFIQYSVVLLRNMLSPSVQ
jgi:hypothetical protein